MPVYRSLTCLAAVALTFRARDPRQRRNLRRLLYLKGRGKVLHVLISSYGNESPADIDDLDIAVPEALIFDLFDTLERTVADQSFTAAYL